MFLSAEAYSLDTIKEENVIEESRQNPPIQISRTNKSPIFLVTLSKLRDLIRQLQLSSLS